MALIRRLALVAIAVAALGAPANALADGGFAVDVVGPGRVTSTDKPATIDCGQGSANRCSIAFTGTCLSCPDLVVTLRATENVRGFGLSGWSRNCAPSALDPLVCRVTVSTRARTLVTATFADVAAPEAGPPTVGPIVAGTVDVSAVVTDNVGVAGVTFRAGDKSFDAVRTSGDTWTARIDSTQLPDGPTSFTTSAVDTARNPATSAAAAVTIDNGKPTLAISGPADGQTFGPGSALSWGLAPADALTAIAEMRCSVVTAGSPAAFAPCSGAGGHDVSGLGEGAYTFSVAVRDGAGNELVVSRSFSIAAAPPPPAPETRVLPVVSPPVALAAIAPAGPVVAPQQIVVTLGFTFRSSIRVTKLSGFVVKNVPPGSTVTVKCPKGCARTSFLKRAAGGEVSLRSLLKPSLRVNTAITVIVSRPGSSSAVKTLTIQAKKAPKITTQCQPEGAPRPVAC